jgi:2,4-dienoyl-CoA reductase-like NADH-dependent reductase (Old Yellow Enzyme family)
MILVKIRSVELKNRIVVSPMCQYSSIDGFANDWHLVHLGSRAIGGAGLVIFEATAVSPEGRITHEDLGIWKDEHVPFLKRIVDFIESHGSVAGIQLAHAGRKASHESPWKGAAPLTGEKAWETLAPSPIVYKEGDPVPTELSLQAIERMINDFQSAAKRALQAGFKVVELHGAHGYLLNEFLSPLSNTRTDSYGGSFENRIRFLLDIVAKVREVWPDDYPLFVRLSATDYAEGGWTLDDSIKLSQILKNRKVDLIDCSSGGNIYGVKIKLEPGYQVKFAESIKKEVEIMTGAIGLITEAKQADDIITSGKADLVLMARELLRNPYFPLHAAKELAVDLEWPDQYKRAKII